MAAGKSTLARELAQRENAVLLVQDEFLDRLFPGEITDIAGFIKESSTRSTKTIRIAHLVRIIDPKTVVGAMTTETLQAYACNAIRPAVTSPSEVLPIL